MPSEQTNSDLAPAEDLHAQIAELREEAHALEILNRTCTAVAAEHDLERLVQMVTDAGVELSHASFGAFFYNVLRDDGEAYMLYTLSGAPREAFSKFPMPRNTAIFEPTFRGEGVVRSDDILADPRYCKSAPHRGMPADIKARAFDPFFTTKDVGHGTGLGLSQVYGFVNQSRGHVKIYSEPGEGTTLKLYFPRVHAQSDSLDDEDEMAPARGSAGETILVVEDDPDVRIYSCETLGELGYAVLEAENGRAALNLIDTRSDIRLLFTDVGLPGGMNGRQLAEEAQKRRPDLKVLFTTGYARNAIIHDGRLDPGVELITKPFTQAAIAAKLRDILDAERPPGRVLLVEDEALIQMLAAEFLETAGFTVDTAGSATEAMNKLKLIPGGMDAAVVDIGLPDRQGDVLVREMRAMYPSLPVVIASGRGIEELRHAFKGEQKISIISKPYMESDLLTALRTLGLTPKG